MSKMDKEFFWLVIGEIVAPQGLRGEVRVNPSSDFPERFLQPGNRWLQRNDEKPKQIKLQYGRKIPGKSIYVISFDGIKDRNSAECLVGKKLLVKSTQKPSLKKGEFHLLELLGVKVKLSHQENEIGVITNLTHAGNDLLEVRLLKGKKILVPFVKEIVPEINIKEGWLIISPPPGLLEL